MKYTNVDEMTAQVNELLEMVTKAKKMANELAWENGQNWDMLRWGREEAMSEQRPLSTAERITEAKRQRELFEDIGVMLGVALNSISRNY